MYVAKREVRSRLAITTVLHLRLYIGQLTNVRTGVWKNTFVVHCCGLIQRLRNTKIEGSSVYLVTALLQVTASHNRPLPCFSASCCCGSCDVTRSLSPSLSLCGSTDAITLWPARGRPLAAERSVKRRRKDEKTKNNVI